MLNIDWSKITFNDFEELCYHLLEELEFSNIDWIGSHGRDRQRDLRAAKMETPLPGIQELRKWIIQCKRYVSRPPSRSDLEKTITWCSARKLDYLLFIFPNTLTSGTYDWLDGKRGFVQFKILTLERPKLETLLLDHVDRLKPFLPPEIAAELCKNRTARERERLVPSIVEKKQNMTHMHVLREKAIDPWIDYLEGGSGTISVVTGTLYIESTRLGSVVINREIRTVVRKDPEFGYLGELKEHLSSGYSEELLKWEKLKEGFKKYLKDVNTLARETGLKIKESIQGVSEMLPYYERGPIPSEKFFVPLYLLYIVYQEIESELSGRKRYFTPKLKLLKGDRKTFHLECGAFSRLAQGTEADMRKIKQIFSDICDDPDLKQKIRTFKKKKETLNRNLEDFKKFLSGLSKLIENGRQILGDCDICRVQ